MPLENDLINQNVIDRLAKIIKNDRLAHAYLFTGPAGAGKSETALEIARMINCEKSVGMDKLCLPPTYCAPCTKILSSQHPDVHIIASDAESGTIKIEQVRDILGQTHLRPYEGRKKIFIIRNVEELTLEGANALLKTLEEPTASSLLFLTTAYLEKNLATIRSRCQIVPFSPMSKQKLARAISSYYDVSASEAHFLAYYAEGCLGKARRLYERKILEFKNETIDGFILANNSETFLKKVVTDKDKIKNFLDILMLWMRDCWAVKSRVQTPMLIHKDRLREIEEFSARFTSAELDKLTNEVVNTHKMLAENLNVKIPLMLIKERMFT